MYVVVGMCGNICMHVEVDIGNHSPLTLCIIYQGRVFQPELAAKATLAR